MSATAQVVQNVVYEVGKAHGFEPLRAWFAALYEVLLGQTQGPRFGSFAALFGCAQTAAMIRQALAGEFLDMKRLLALSLLLFAAPAARRRDDEALSRFMPKAITTGRSRRARHRTARQGLPLPRGRRWPRRCCAKRPAWHAWSVPKSWRAHPLPPIRIRPTAMSGWRWRWAMRRASLAS